MRPNYAKALIGLGDTYWAQHHDREARSAFARALEAYELSLDPAVDAAYASVRAVCLAKMGGIEEAVSEIRRLQEEAPDLERLDFNAARVYALAGDKELMLHHMKTTIADFRHVEVFRSYPSFRDYQDDPDFRAILEGARHP